MRVMSFRPADRLAIALLALLACASIGPGLLPDRVFASVHTATRRPLDLGMTEGFRAEALERDNNDTGDQVLQVLPERHAVFTALGRGELPLWYGEAGGGVSLVGAPAAELFEPRVLLLGAWLGVDGSLGLLAALSLFVLLGLAYLHLRLLDLAPVAAAGGAIAFALSGAVVSSLFLASKVDSLVLLPGGLAAIELWLRGRRATAFALLVAVAADSALASFQQGTAFSAYAVAGVAIARFASVRRARGAEAAPLGGLVLLGLAALLGLLMASFHLLPVLDAIAASSRSTAQGGSGFTVAPAHFLSLLVPFVLGNPTSDLALGGSPAADLVPGLRGPTGFSFTETTFYLGLAALPFLLAGLGRGSRALLPGLAAVGALAIAMGSPLVHLPGIAIGAPSRALPFVAYFLTWLAAEGIDGLAVSTRCRRAALAGALLLAGAAAAAVALRAAVPAEDVVARVAAARGAESPGDLSVVARRWSEEIRPELLVVAGLALLSAGAVALGALRPALRFVAVIVLAADLAAFALRVLPPRPARSFFPEIPAIRWIREETGTGRVARLAPFEQVTIEDALLFQSLLPSAFRLRDVSAYVVLPDAAQASVAGAFFPESVVAGTFVGAFPQRALASPVLDLLGVRLVMAREPLDAPGLAAVSSRDGFHAYVRRNAPGRAWVVAAARFVDDPAAVLAAITDRAFDPMREVILEGGPPESAHGGRGGGRIEVEEISNREVRIRAIDSGGGWLFDSAPPGPGWTATVDGRPTPIRRANRGFRAVPVPPGTHEVRFVYLPRSFVGGAFLSAFSLAVAIAVFRRLARRRAEAAR